MTQATFDVVQIQMSYHDNVSDRSTMTPFRNRSTVMNWTRISISEIKYVVTRPYSNVL